MGFVWDGESRSKYPAVGELERKGSEALLCLDPALSKFRCSGLEQKSLFCKKFRASSWDEEEEQKTSLSSSRALGSFGVSTKSPLSEQAESPGVCRGGDIFLVNSVFIDVSLFSCFF